MTPEDERDTGFDSDEECPWDEMLQWPDYTDAQLDGDPWSGEGAEVDIGE